MKIVIQEYRGKKTKKWVKFKQSTFPVDTPFEHTLFVDSPLIGEELRKTNKSHVVSINHGFGGLMHITFQYHYDLQYITNVPKWIYECTNGTCFS